MTKRIILATLTLVLGTSSGPVFAYSNVSPKAPPPKLVSHRQAPGAVDVLDPTITQRVTESDAYRYRGGPKWND